MLDRLFGRRTFLSRWMQGLAVLTLANPSPKPLGPANVSSTVSPTAPGKARGGLVSPIIKNIPNEILPESYSRFQLDPSRYIAQSDLVWEAPEGPPANWIDGVPVGNGDFGAIVYGYPDNLSFALGKTDIWNRRDIGRSNFPAGTFADLRKTYFDQDEVSFSRFQQGNGRRFFDYSSEVAHLTDAGIFRLHLAEDCIAADCTTRLSLYEAVGRMGFVESGRYAMLESAGRSKTSVEYFVSREHDVLVIRLLPGNHPLGQVSWELNRAQRPECPEPVVSQEKNVACLRQQMPAGDSFVIAVTVNALGARWNKVGNCLAGDLVVQSMQPLEIYLTVVTSFDAPDPLDEAGRRLSTAVEMKYEGLLAFHRRWWKGFWERSFVSFGDKAAEKWWYISNYFCGSIFRPGKQTPGLQGVWVKENHPAWNGDYHGNVNMQVVYGGLYPGNRLELAEPYFRYYTDILPQCRKDASEYFQMRGARLPLAGDTHGYELSDTWITLSTSISPSGWLAHLFWQYYEYTADKEFLGTVAYPLLREVALFYEDYLLKDDQGRYVVEPSVNGEALCPGFQSWGKNSGYDLSIIRVTFEAARQAAQILSRDHDLQLSWEDKLDHLSSIPTTPEGIWKPWEDRGEVYAERLMFPVFPMELASAFHGPEELRSQALKTWKYWREKKLLPSALTDNGGSVAARMGDTEWALQVVRWNAKPDTRAGEVYLSKNGGITGPNRTYVQYDLGPGMSRALSDMMLLCLGGVLHVFPGVPKGIPARFHSLRTQGAFLVTAEKRGEGIDYVLVQSLAGNHLRIANPFPERASLRSLTKGRTVVANTWNIGEVVESVTEKGELFVLESASRPLESIPKEVLSCSQG